ncbi:MAG: hypothetical protein IJI05_05770, partial [Erysipelotrichaceae bacterium]|nr:hypothetical protein [Erysipelotrichaceae bacterium]
LAEAFLRLYQGDFPAAMEALLYCRKQDMEKDNLASVYLMRCKILMFMDQLTADNPDFQYIVRHRSGFNLFERFDYQLISGYMHLRNGDTEKTHQILDQLNSLDPSVSPRAFLWPHEIRWLNSMAVLHDYSQFNFNTQYNLHRGSGSPKYIMASISRQERKDD